MPSSSNIKRLALSAITSAVFLLLGSLVLSPFSSQLLAKRKLISKARDSVDPYRQTGYVYWSEDVTQTCFIPYDSESLLEEMPVSSKLEPPASALAKAAPPFNRWTVQANASINPDLEFLRNKHVVFSCDSHCVNIITGFCDQHQAVGATLDHKLHIFTVCHLPTLNFTMSAWFHFGVVQRDDFWYDEALKQPPPIQFEDRLDEVHLPRSEIDGTPDLIIFDSAYWDNLYFGHRGYIRDQNMAIPNFRDGMSYSELSFHRKRFAEMIGHMQKRLPNTKIMWKGAHERAANTHTSPGMTGSMDLIHIDRSSQALAKHLGVPSLEWPEKVQGYSHYSDQFHLKSNSGATWLATDMVMYYLYRMSLGMPL